MEHRRLGTSSIDIPVIGFGCGRQAQLMIGDDEALRIETVRLALEGGLNYFDTSGAYGDGLSEINLGRVLRELDADPIISSKVLLEPEDVANPRAAVLRNFEQGLERLGRDHVDVLLLHNQLFSSIEPGQRGPVGAALTLDHIFGSDGVAKALEEIRAAHGTRAIGFTAFGGNPKPIGELIDSGLFACLNAQLHLLNPSAVRSVPKGFPEENFELVISHAAERGLGVMALAVFHRGVLAGKGPVDGRAAVVASVARRHDEVLATAAIRYVLGHNAVTTAILGLSEPRHVAEALEAVRKGPFGSDAIEEIEQAALR